MPNTSSPDTDDALIILVVDDDNTLRTAIRNQLRRNYRVICSGDGPSALRRFRTDRPDLVLLDVNMPDLDGHQVARQMRAIHGDQDWVPIIFLSGADDDDEIAKAIAAGGDDYLVKPVSRQVLIAKIDAMQRIAAMRKELIQVKTDLEHANAELQRQALIDDLTGVANRRCFDHYLAREWNRQLRFGRPLALILLDVDHFKDYNDRYGHQQGDACLRRLATVLRRQLQRTTDLVARYGGEEFAVVLPEFTAAAAQRFADELRRAVRAAGIEHAAAPAGLVTVSLGVISLIPSAEQSHSTLIERADRALYRAKAAGRDRTVSDD